MEYVPRRERELHTAGSLLIQTATQPLMVEVESTYPFDSARGK